MVGPLPAFRFTKCSIYTGTHYKMCIICHILFTWAKQHVHYWVASLTDVYDAPIFYKWWPTGHKHVQLYYGCNSHTNVSLFRILLFFLSIMFCFVLQLWSKHLLIFLLLEVVQTFSWTTQVKVIPTEAFLLSHSSKSKQAIYLS